jgi:LysM repeat protein
MRWPYLAFGTILAAGLFSSCGPTGGTAGNHRRNPSGTGPFDSHGNYVEAWADSPSKWNKSTRQASVTEPTKSTALAANDEPPPDAIPLPPSGTNPAASVSTSSKHKKKSSEATVASTRNQPVEVASLTKHAVSSLKSKHTEIAARGHETETSTKSKHKTTASRDRERDALPKTKTKHTAMASADTPSKSKHKALASSDTPPKTKHKKVAENSASKKTKTPKKATASASSRYTVKSGDSLERIARHSHTSVGALKRANGLSGETLHPGKSLVIPRD